jgi:hypothetical protein
LGDTMDSFCPDEPVHQLDCPTFGPAHKHTIRRDSLGKCIIPPCRGATP